MFKVAAFVAAVLFPISALAVPITVHNTGVDSTDALVGAGESTTFWTLLSAPLGASELFGSNPFRYYNGAYVADSATSAWVSPGETGEASFLGLYVYQLFIDLTGLNPATAVITGGYGTDNSGFIRVNGGSNAATTASGDFAALTSFTLNDANSDFVAGLNLIEVGVDNEGNPTAFRVEFTGADADALNGAAPIPEPASLLLLGTGLAALVRGRVARRKRGEA